MKHLLMRSAYKSYLLTLINFFWVFWYLRNSKKIKRVSRIFDTWNREIPSFSYKFPSLNTKTFIKHYKYWIHWIRKMDPREKLIFNNLNPIVLVNEKEWMHFDLSKKEIPVLYYTFYFADYKWIPIVIFNEIEQLQYYLSMPDATTENLLLYINSNVISERLSITEENIRKNQGGHSGLIIDENGIHLSPEYLEELKRKRNS